MFGRFSDETVENFLAKSVVCGTNFEATHERFSKISEVRRYSETLSRITERIPKRFPGKIP